jgi:hypothetical protein
MVLAREILVLVAGAQFYAPANMRNISMAGKNTPPTIGWKSALLSLPFEHLNSAAPLSYGLTPSTFKKE